MSYPTSKAIMLTQGVDRQQYRSSVTPPTRIRSRLYSASFDKGDSVKYVVRWYVYKLATNTVLRLDQWSEHFITHVWRQMRKSDAVQKRRWPRHINRRRNLWKYTTLALSTVLLIKILSTRQWLISKHNRTRTSIWQVMIWKHFCNDLVAVLWKQIDNRHTILYDKMGSVWPKTPDSVGHDQYRMTLTYKNGLGHDFSKIIILYDSGLRHNFCRNWHYFIGNKLAHSWLQLERFHDTIKLRSNVSYH